MCDNAFPQLTIKAFWKSYMFNNLLYYFGIKLQENTLVNTSVFLMQSHKDAIKGLFAIGAKPKKYFCCSFPLYHYRSSPTSASKTPEMWNGFMVWRLYCPLRFVTTTTTQERTLSMYSRLFELCRPSICVCVLVLSMFLWHKSVWGKRYRDWQDLLVSQTVTECNIKDVTLLKWITYFWATQRCFLQIASVMHLNWLQ